VGSCGGVDHEALSRPEDVDEVVREQVDLVGGLSVRGRDCSDCGIDGLRLQRNYVCGGDHTGQFLKAGHWGGYVLTGHDRDWAQGGGERQTCGDGSVRPRYLELW